MPKNNVTDPITDHEEKLVDQEAKGLRKLTIGRDQVLERLWELAALSYEQTRGSIAGQIKALAMIAAIEGLIPDRRLSPHATKPTTPPVEPDIYKSEWLRNQQGPSVSQVTGDPVAVKGAQPAAPRDPAPQPAAEPVTNLANQASAPNLDPPQSSIANPFINPGRQNWVPAAADSGVDAFLDTTPLFEAALFPKTFLEATPLKSQKRSNFIEFYKISHGGISGQHIPIGIERSAFYR